MQKPNFKYYNTAIEDLLDFIQRVDARIKLFSELGGTNQFTVDQLHDERNRYTLELESILKAFDDEVWGIVLPKAA